MEPYLGQLLLAGFSFAPAGWALCDGSLLSIAEFSALFTLIGTIYGGDGLRNFALPDLRGRTSIGTGQALSGTNYIVGQTGGAEQVLIGMPNYPVHTHSILVNAAGSNTNSPANSVMGSGTTVYANTSVLNAPLNTATCGLSGTASPTPHNNLQPYLTLNWIIALYGVYPSRS